MSLAMTPPEQGRRCATMGVVAHNVNRATFCLRVDGDVLLCAFDSTESLSRSLLQLIPEYQSVNVHAFKTDVADDDHPHDRRK